jgi:photosystem II stability/assembly factor-like uncharacterized protein
MMRLLIGTVLRLSRAVLALATVHAVTATAAQGPTSNGGSRPAVELRAAVHPHGVDHTLLLGVTRAGQRIVAVGEGGTVALSDDSGKTFRRARTVPVQATLTAVFFADNLHGWAVGHWGVILATSDGGETWFVQHADPSLDQPLFAVRFSDSRNGLAVGLWSMMYRTTDGGATWQRITVPPQTAGHKADRNLFAIFADTKGVIYVPAEAGQVLASSDGGQTWRYIDTGYTGSLWCGLALPDGGLLVGGLRGTLMRSDDGGATWSLLPVPLPRSITALTNDGKGGVLGTGLDGLYLQSRDGRRFEASVLSGRPVLTGVVVSPAGRPLLISKNGPTQAAPAVSR